MLDMLQCKSKNILFVINQPNAYKIPASYTCIVFGKAKIEVSKRKWLFLRYS